MGTTRMHTDPRQGVARLHAEPPLLGVSLPESVPLQTAPCTDYRALLKADFSASDQWVFRGAYPSECGERVWPVAYNDPSRHAARAIGGVWRSIGGQLSGQVQQLSAIARAQGSSSSLEGLKPCRPGCRGPNTR